jgi:hypothetical protein
MRGNWQFEELTTVTLLVFREQVVLDTDAGVMSR